MDNNISGLKKAIEKSPEDKVIAKVKEMIHSGSLKPGDRLPAERKFAAELGFGRTAVREALHKLEFYGIIKTLPQSGSIINGLDISTLDGLISDVLTLQNYDFFSLVETRFVLEVNVIRLCAIRATDSDIRTIEHAHEDFVQHFNTAERVSKDFAFHRAIAEGSHNPVLKAMLLIIIPDIMTIYQRDRVCSLDPAMIDEHALLVTHIKNKDSEKAAKVMEKHLKGVVDFAKSKIPEY